MNRIISGIFTLMIISGCGTDYSHTKFYDYIIDNQLSTSTVKVIPLNHSDFWIIPADTFLVIPGEKIIIGNKIHYDDNRIIVDLYQPSDTIESFELLIDDILQEKDFTRREFWNFQLGSVDESGIYSLIIDENILND